MSSSLSVICSDDTGRTQKASFSAIGDTSRQTTDRTAVSSNALSWLKGNAQTNTTARQLRSMAKRTPALRKAIRKLLHGVPNAATVTKTSDKGATSFLEFHSSKPLHAQTTYSKKSSAAASRVDKTLPMKSGRRSRRRHSRGGGRSTRSNAKTGSRVSAHSHNDTSRWTGKKSGKSDTSRPLTRRELGRSKGTATDSQSKYHSQSTQQSSPQSGRDTSNATCGRTDRKGEKGGRRRRRRRPTTTRATSRGSPESVHSSPGGTSSWGGRTTSKASQAATSNTSGNDKWNTSTAQDPSNGNTTRDTRRVAFAESPTSRVTSETGASVGGGDRGSSQPDS